MKHRIKLYDKIFAHTYTMSNGYLKLEPDNFVWYRGDDYCDVSVFTDFSLDEVDNCDSKIKIALLMESPAVFPDAYNKILLIKDKFDLVLTFKSSLVLLSKKINYYPLGGTWIKSEDWQVYNKTKLCSFIASNKKQSTGHIVRHQIYDLIKDNPNIDCYGEIANNPIEYKLDALKDYKFSIVIENDDIDGYFTEKLIDCVLTGTIPIIWSARRVTEFSSMSFQNPKDILEIVPIDGRPNKMYSDMFNIRDFYHAQHRAMPENYLWDHYFKELI